MSNHDFYEHFKRIMSAEEVGNFTEDQIRVIESVREKVSFCSSLESSIVISESTIDKFIKTLKGNCSPGSDGVTSEHIKYGKSDILCQCLSTLYSFIISYGVVPSTFTIGVIVPALKKPNLNINDPVNYRPITIGSTFAKLMEMYLLPPDNSCDSQFGFREKRGTDFCCSLINDISTYFRKTNSP